MKDRIAAAGVVMAALLAGAFPAGSAAQQCPQGKTAGSVCSEAGPAHQASPASGDSARAEPGTSALELPPLTVDVRSQALVRRGFYDRREHLPGAFLTRAQWERRSPATPSDVLRTIPGVSVQPARRGFDNVVLDRHGCIMRYFVDGARAGPTFRLDELDVHSIEALEIYRGASEVPARFAAFNSAERGTCGVSVVWLRLR